jgi:hypothetical protein
MLGTAEICQLFGMASKNITIKKHNPDSYEDFKIWSAIVVLFVSLQLLQKTEKYNFCDVLYLFFKYSLRCHGFLI